MTTRFYPTYKCRFCEKKFDDGRPYDSAKDAAAVSSGLINWHPVHNCDRGHLGVGDFTGFERVDIGE